MSNTKTTYTGEDVSSFINSYVEKKEKREDSYRLIELLQEWSGFEPKMWGPSIIGFGNYHYKYESGHEGDAPILGFSPRKTAFSLYMYSETVKSKNLLKKLGKFKMGKSCIYVKKLENIDTSVLQQICNESIRYLNENHECACIKTKKSS